MTSSLCIWQWHFYVNIMVKSHVYFKGRGSSFVCSILVKFLHVPGCISWAPTIWSAPIRGNRTSALTFKGFPMMIIRHQSANVRHPSRSVSSPLCPFFPSVLPRGNAPVRKERNGCKGHRVPIRSASLNPISAQFMPLSFENGKKKALCWLGKNKNTANVPPAHSVG